MRDFLRFILSEADQARVDSASVTVIDTPPGNSTGADHALISFRITNPAAGAPQLRPAFPGFLRYEASPVAPGNLPEPQDIVLTPAGYATWRTRGTLLIRTRDTKLDEWIRQHGSGLEERPNLAWYWPVQLTETFMLTTLTSGLRKEKIGISTNGEIKPTNPNWPKHAVSRFLQGLYYPALRLGTTAPDDDVVKHSMPSVVMEPNGNVTLTIAMAHAQPPQDSDLEQLDAITPDVDKLSPFHARNPGIPARHFYRLVRDHLIDGGPTAPLADLVLKSWPHARRYFPFKITRTWQNIPNFSVVFPSRSVKVITSPTSSIVLRIPAHGVVYVPQDPATPEPQPPELKLESILPSTNPPTTFLDGATANAWRVKSSTDPVPLSTTSVTHVILRRPLREEILADPVFPEPEENRCTYMSLRRVTRAFVDHRVTGGRLTHEVPKTLEPTRDLMIAAWNTNSAKILWNGKPSPGDLFPGQASRRMEKIWRLFFPDIVPAKVIDSSGSTDRTVLLDGGQMMYSLWQSNQQAFANNGSKRNFSNDHVGMGAPGAIFSVGLSKGFLTTTIPHINPSPTELEIKNNIDEMLNSLTPGCVLQFWVKRVGYQRMRSRSNTDEEGHSPIFQEYLLDANGDKIGIIVVDQFGKDIRCPVREGRLTWSGVKKDIWIAAQWDD
jgi:hypothetical protein